MVQAWLALPLQLATRTFLRGGKLNIVLIGSLVLVGGAQIVALLIAASLDGTLWLPAPDKGLMQHYGAWAMLLSDPLCLIAAGYAYSRFRAAFLSAPLQPDVVTRRRWLRLVRRQLDWINGKGNRAFAYVLCLFPGIAGWIVNIRQTAIDPHRSYFHDVFDGKSHIAGFVVFKICLFDSWVIVFPIVGYLILTMSYSTWSILYAAKRNGLFLPSVTHPDGCYGFAKFGVLNVSLLWPFLLAYAVMLSLLATHARPYESIVVPLVGMTIVFVVVSYFVLFPLYFCIRDARKKVFTRLLRQSSEAEDLDAEGRSRFVVERLCYTSASSTPYAGSTRLVLTGMRAVTIGTAAFKLFEQYHGLIGI
jgi:hypothetical protein